VSKQLTLFEPPNLDMEPISNNNYKGKPRLLTVCRNQFLIHHSTLDSLLPPNHLARDVWKYVERLDLSTVLNKIESVEGSVGRPATDPKVFLALWLYATLKGINSARLIEEYCNEHDAFKWICGGINVNYHSISDFRSKHGDQLHDLLTQSVALLSKNGIISLEKVSHDGMRVRASAGSGSFRRESTLESHLKLAKEMLDDLKKESEKNPGACKSRLEAAKLRAAEEKTRNIEAALNELKEIREEKIKAAKKQRKKVDQKEIKNVRSSMTDSEARVMKMACNGFRPAYNVQFVTTNIGKAIIGVEVNNKSDAGQLLNLIEQIGDRYEMIPDIWNADSGYRSNENLDIIAERYPNCEVHMPLKKTSQPNPYQKRKGDSEAVGKWRERMGTEEAKKNYKERGATAEYSNAQTRNKGFQQFCVRGIEKVNCVAIIYALAHNFSIFNGMPLPIF
jgi:transposase